jgi:NAD(P)H dehydrogenase (quinone)
MRVFQVVAHPEPHSFTAALAETVSEELRGAGHQVMQSDLYEMKFNPIASGADFHDQSRSDYLTYSLEQRHGFASGTLSKDIAEEVQKVQSCDLLVLAFPIFWYSVPGIMKGWIDCVFLSGPMFGGRRYYDRGPMKGKQALVVATLGGREHMFGPGKVHPPLDVLLSHLLRGMLAYVGFDVLKPFFGFHVPYVDHSERATIQNDLRGVLHNLSDREVLSAPSLDDFDPQAHPLSEVGEEPPMSWRKPVTSDHGMASAK